MLTLYKHVKKSDGWEKPLKGVLLVLVYEEWIRRKSVDSRKSYNFSIKLF